MKLYAKHIIVAACGLLLLTILTTPLLANTTIVSAMADLDQAIIPAAAYSNQGKLAETRAAVSRLESQWALFLVSTQNAFPADEQWDIGLDKVDVHVAEVSNASESGDLKKVHEILEAVRNILEDLRRQRNITYYLDGFSKYRRILEDTTTVLDGKKGSDLTAADIQSVATRIPMLKAAWASLQSAHLDAALFRLDPARVAKIREAMDAVRQNIEKLESVTPGGSGQEVYQALRLIKPSLKKAFLLFGDI